MENIYGFYYNAGEVAQAANVTECYNCTFVSDILLDIFLPML